MADELPTEDEVFQIARGIDDLETRAAYLRQACGEDSQLFERVVELLRVTEDADSFLENPPQEVAATQLQNPLCEKPGDQIGHFKLLQKIGEGGFGVVYMAEQLQPISRRVAVKIIKPGMDSQDVIARFEAERQALAMMNHPNIAKVLDAGQTEHGRPYFVMELVNGVPLTQFCDDRKLPTNDRLELFTSVCNAIQHAHHKGVIHRDIKPANVLVTLHDDKPIVKVIDFGIAKAINQKLTEKSYFTQFGQMIGTPQYMSPEQAEISGLDIDTRCDVYSLGVLLYELLTGTTPLKSSQIREAGFAEMQRLIKEESPPKPSTRVSGNDQQSTDSAKQRRTTPDSLRRVLRGDLDWVAMKALAKDRGRRYETANGLAEEIGRYLANEPVQARPPSTVYRTQKFVARNRSLVWSAGVTVTAIVCLLIGLFAYLQQTRQHLEVVKTGYFHRQVELLLSGKTLPETAEAMDGKLDPWQIQMLQGIDAKNQGKMEVAVEHLETAARLNPSRSVRAAKLYPLLLSGGDVPFELALDDLLDEMSDDPMTENDYLANLFVGHALSFRDAPKGIPFVRRAIERSNSLYAQKVLAEIYSQIATDGNSVEDAEESLRLAHAVCLMQPNNKNYYGQLLASQLTCIRCYRLAGRDSTELEIEAQKTAAHFPRNANQDEAFAMGQYLAGSLYTMLGDDKRALEHFSRATGRGFHRVSSASAYLRLGDLEGADRRLSLGEDRSDYQLISRGIFLGITSQNIKVADAIYERTKDARAPSGSHRAIWIIPEAILLATQDEDRAVIEARRRIRESSSSMADWELARLEFVRAPLSQESIDDLQGKAGMNARQSQQQLMAAYVLIGLKYWANGDRAMAVQYLEDAQTKFSCYQWPQALFSGALAAFLKPSSEGLENDPERASVSARKSGKD